MMEVFFLFFLFFATWPDRPKLFLSYFIILQFTLVATLRRFPVLELILDGIDCLTEFCL